MPGVRDVTGGGSQTMDVVMDTGVDALPVDMGVDVPMTTGSCPSPGERGCGLVAIPCGTFTMGGDPGGYDPETISGVPRGVGQAKAHAIPAALRATLG